MAQNPVSGKKTLIIKSVLVVGAVVLALGLGMWLRQMQGDDTANAPSGKDGVDTSSVDTMGKKMSTETETASLLANNGQVEESNKYIAEQLAKPGATNEQKYDLYRQQSLNAANSGNWQVVFDAGIKANDIKPSSTLLESVADAAVSLGRKTDSNTYYKKAIAQLDKEQEGNPTYEGDRKKLENKLNAQGGSL